MSLLACQQQMIALMRGAADLDESNLTPEEKCWFSQLQFDKGLEVTRDIIQWWRRTRLNYAMPFTLKYLHYLHHDHWIDLYISQHPCRTLFFSLEGQQFYQFLLSQNPHPNRLLLSLAQFETALREAHANHYPHNTQIHIIWFECSPQAFFSTLLQNRLKEGLEYQPHEVTVSAQLPGLWTSVALVNTPR
jgi:hypothetical protein